jgi:hypothetical protein
MNEWLAKPGTAGKKKHMPKNSHVSLRVYQTMKIGT